MTCADVARETGLAKGDLRRFYDLFACHPRVVPLFSQGVNQASDGTDKVNAIINCHLAGGRIGKPGAGPFSITGQPNAMGGREVGGLANQLAAHMELENADHRDRVRRFWRSPAIACAPGPKAVDLFKAVGDGRIKALWIMATNPAVSMPDADAVQAALAACPFVVVSDTMADTDTARFADALLPAAAWGEKDGTVTNSERRISRQRAFRTPPGEALPDWRIVCEVAKRMGYGDAFAYRSPGEIFAEHAALSAFENDGSRDFDIGALAGLDSADYDALKPTQWPTPGKREKPDRPFASGAFFTVDGRARFVPTPAEAPRSESPLNPLVLNTGRIRDQWHTMTNTGRLARLSAHIAEPFVEMSPLDAAMRGIGPGTLVEVLGARGRMVGRVSIDDGQRPGSVFAPMHWTNQFASTARIGAVIEARTDPVSGQPELKRSAVEVRRFQASWYGLAVLRDRPATIGADYWAVSRTRDGWRVELAGMAPPLDWNAWIRTIVPAAGDDLLAYHDAASGQHRFALFDGARLIGAAFFAPRPIPVGRAFIAKGLGAHYPAAGDRLRFLAGRPGADRPDPGATVCSCFEIGLNTIVAAVVDDGCVSVEAIGAALRAGTNCGSCRPEIGRIIHEHAVKEAV
jgi:assimilatory nitrate reductase catalytic subunit